MEMSDKTKKNRSTNFTKNEELLLVEEVQKEHYIIECKVTNKVSTQEKEKSWEKIQNNFNSKNYQYRSIEQLKSKYDNLKTKARKMVANNKKSFTGTGGGPFFGGGGDPVLDLVLKIINIKTVIGIEYAHDSDNAHHTSTEPSASIITENVVDESFPIIVLEDREMSMHQVDGHDIAFSNEENMMACSASMNKEQPIAFQENENKKISTPKATLTKRKADSDWSSYVPRKLKEPISKKLRPVVDNPFNDIKKEYYLAKTEYLRGECKVQQQKYEFAQKEEERRQQEHAVRMKILELEYQKVQKELQGK